ncbi:expressed unknown protein [Seminavis robusta]|uniref:Uncharacterized protein n=1 Tax=Seminavis robusta TaxID=568900 RepID=A0A9N8H308_9STRA|nr:expressed unknown protein [Seminavis robusta]|eukprot:Sro28_g018800.1 n/a (440) ;mRNA; f:122838-124157
MPIPPKAGSTGTTKSTKKSSKNGLRSSSSTSINSTASGTASGTAMNMMNTNTYISTSTGNVTPMPKAILKRPTTTNPKTHNRKLTFHNKKKTKRIPNVASMPPEILEDIWWAAEDYDDIMRSFEYTVFMMEAGEAKAVEDDQHCTRGLELRTEAGKWARFEHKRDCYNAVLDEQDRQWNEGEDNQDKIANCCREVTAKTQRIACRKGMQDEKDIEKYVADTRKAIDSNQLLHSSSSSNHNNNNKQKKTTSANGTKSMPARTKSNSTGQLKRRTPRTDSGKARVEKSPPRKPERVLSGKSERGDVTPTNSSSAPRTPKRTVSSGSKQSDGSASPAPSNNNNKGMTPTNSAKSNTLRMPQRQTFNNSSSKATPSSSSSSRQVTKGNSTKASSTLPKLPKRSASNSSQATAASLDNSSMGGDGDNDGKGGQLSVAALAKFGA